MSKIFD